MTSLSAWAWRAHAASRPRSGIKVGAAVYASNGAVYTGSNIELGFRLGLHAEVNALSSMLTSRGDVKPLELLIAAERADFGPCGSCLDWIMQLNPDCIIFHERQLAEVSMEMPARMFMPYYPSND